MTEITPIEYHNGVWIKRDDFFIIAGVCGGKVRTCLHLAETAKKQGKVGICTAGAKHSPQVQIVACVAKYLGLKARCHTPTGKYSPEIESAAENGAEIIQHTPGWNSVIVARAHQDCKNTGYFEIPFGMECWEAVKQTRNQIDSIPSEIKRIVIPVGSGMSTSGILNGLKYQRLNNIKILGVVVGADPIKRLDQYAPMGWRRQLDLVHSDLSYNKSAKSTVFEGIDLDPVYEAKCIPFIEKGDLFWVVGKRGISEKYED